MKNINQTMTALLMSFILFSLLLTGCKPVSEEPGANADSGDISQEGGSELIPDAGPVSPSEEDAPYLVISKAEYYITTEIFIKYYVTLENAQSADGLKLLVWQQAPKNGYYQGGTQSQVLTSFTQVSEDGNDYFVFEYSGYKYTDIATPIYTRAILDGKGVLSAVNKYSILSYAYENLGIIDPEERTDDEALAQKLEETVSFADSIQKYLGVDLSRPLGGDWYKISVEGGRLADGFAEGLYFPGDTVALRANTAEGKEFSHWECDGVNVGSSEKIEITVADRHETYIAVYK